MNNTTTFVGGQDVSSLPALVSEGHAPHLSTEYVKVDTKRVIEILTSNGFEAASVKQDKARTRDPRFVKHMVDFRRTGNDAMTAVGGLNQRFGSVPRFLFTNSHNGTTRASFRLGVYRFICSNGMVVGSDWARESFIHTGEIAKQLEARLAELMKSADKLFDEVGAWSGRKLTKAEQTKLADIGQKIRFNGSTPVLTSQLLAPRRFEDGGDDLWTVFNRLQEHLSKGGLGGLSPTGRDTTTKPIESIANTMAFNTEFWAAASEMLQDA